MLTEIMAVTVGLDRAKQITAFHNESFRFDDSVVVLGVGPLDMCFVVKARMLGAGTIIAVDLSDYRLDFASKLGPITSSTRVGPPWRSAWRRFGNSRMAGARM